MYIGIEYAKKHGKDMEPDRRSENVLHSDSLLTEKKLKSRVTGTSLSIYIFMKGMDKAITWKVSWKTEF